MADPGASWFSGTTAALTTAVTGILGFLLATVGYLRSGRRERREEEDKARIVAAEKIVADRDFFAQNYRDIIGDLRRERVVLIDEIRGIRHEMATAAAECDSRITALETTIHDLKIAADSDAVMIRNLQEQNRRQERQIAVLENRGSPS